MANKDFGTVQFALQILRCGHPAIALGVLATTSQLIAMQSYRTPL